jgi:hypothetical protein
MELKDEDVNVSMYPVVASNGSPVSATRAGKVGNHITQLLLLLFFVVVAGVFYV